LTVAYHGASVVLRGSVSGQGFSRRAAPECNRSNRIEKGLRYDPRVASVRSGLLFILLVLALAFSVFWWRQARSQPAQERRWPTIVELAIGFITDFLDTLGVGSFATTATLFRATQRVPDRVLPGTMNVGHALPTVLQASIYIAAIDVDVITLATLIVASMCGAYFGARWVAGLSERAVRIGVGCALLVAALLLVARLQGLLPSGGDALGLSGIGLGVGVLGNLLLGALMTLGIGLYAPCMIMVALLGMNPKTAFPIMMGSCAFLMLIAAPRFVRSDSYAARPALGLTLGGLPGVWIAAEIVRELELTTVRWLVLAIVTYTALSLLFAARLKTNEPSTQ
jgi:uncharacterized membrane protein YfcA